MSAQDRCREVKEILPAFLDDELPCDVSHGVQEHLDLCPPCAGYARIEESFTAAMRARVRRIEAPDHVAERLSRALPSHRRAGGIWLGLAAAAAMVALIAATYLITGAGAPPAHVRGILVCVECERHGASIEHQRRCRQQGHHTGILCPRTGLWNLVANDAATPYMADPGRRGEEVSVEGRFLHDIRYLDARSITPGRGGPS